MYKNAFILPPNVEMTILKSMLEYLMQIVFFSWNFEVSLCCSLLTSNVYVENLMPFFTISLYVTFPLTLNVYEYGANLDFAKCFQEFLKCNGSVLGNIPELFLFDNFSIDSLVISVQSSIRYWVT